MITHKNCKAQNKSKGYNNACGDLTPVERLKFGLCSSCLWDWMKTTKDGKIYHDKVFIPKTKKVSEKNRKELIKDKKIKLLSPDKYRAKHLQPIINKIARLIDYGQSCIATDNFGKMNGGHYRSVGSNRTIALNLHNIHIQSYESNVFRGGDDKNYKDGLIDRYGLDYFEFVDGLRMHKPIKLILEDMREIKANAQQICNSLERSKNVLTPSQRIALRNEINAKLSIYDKEYSQFKID